MHQANVIELPAYRQLGDIRYREVCSFELALSRVMSGRLRGSSALCGPYNG